MRKSIIRRIRNSYYGMAISAYCLQLDGLRKSILSNVKKRKQSENYPIDFVVTWVDGSDPEWRLLRKQYEGENLDPKGNTEIRWREWDTFRYWFRAVETYAPWVRKVFLVTCGHVPEWLNLNADKLVVVRHDEFIPEKYLPTFNCNVIELNLHRIKGLSEHFVYFNDDTILNSAVTPSSFFCGGLPKYPLESNLILPTMENLEYRYMRYTDAAVINSEFDIRKCIENNNDKWFSCNSSRHTRRRNRNTYLAGGILGVASQHLYYPLRKRYLEQVWEKVPKQLDERCKHRFRKHNDYTLMLVVSWYLCLGEVEPVTRQYCGEYFDIACIETVIKALKKGKDKVVCLNDKDDISEEQYKEINSKLRTAYENKLPHKSVYEKSENGF